MKKLEKEGSKILAYKRFIEPIVFEEYSWSSYLVITPLSYVETSYLETERSPMVEGILLTGHLKETRSKPVIRTTPKGIQFNIHDLEEGVFYPVDYKGERYLIGKLGAKLIIYIVPK